MILEGSAVDNEMRTTMTVVDDDAVINNLPGDMLYE